MPPLTDNVACDCLKLFQCYRLFCFNIVYVLRVATEAKMCTVAVRGRGPTD